MRLRLAVLGVLLLPTAAAQSQPKLELPVACTLGQDCYVQNYVDHDAGPGWKDFTCGPLSYDGHDGTDIALTDPTAWKRGVPVRASAAGRVKGVRDGMADMSTAAPGAPDVKNRECGNGVVIDHGNGWETQYCHMKRASVRVRLGQQVAAGDALGEIGISGKAEFPHVHLSVRHNGEKLDPYTAEAMPAACGLKPNQLWADNVPYVGTGLAGSGFAQSTPRRYAAMMGDYDQAAFNGRDALYFWVTAFGVRQGDEMQFRVLGPSGNVVVERKLAAPRDRPVAFEFAGGRPRAGELSPGTYRGEFNLVRAGVVVKDSRVVATIN